MKHAAILACLALAAAAAVPSRAAALDDDQVPAVEAEESSLYVGRAREAKAPAVVDADEIFRAISDYQRILEEKLTEKDVRYSFLMVRANRKFRKAVEGAAREEKRDLVGGRGAVTWGKREVPDITATALAHVKAQESIAALRPGGSVSPGGVLSFAPDAKPVELDLSSTRLSDAGLAHVENLAALRSLDLTATPVGDDGIAHLGKVAGLESLNLSGTNVTDRGIALLKGREALRTLDLSGTRVTGAGLASVAKVPGLRTLRLQGTAVDDAGVAALAGMKGLETLALRDTKVPAKVLDTLKGMPALRKVALPATADWKDPLESFRKARPEVAAE